MLLKYIDIPEIAAWQSVLTLVNLPQLSLFGYVSPMRMIAAVLIIALTAACAQQPQVSTVSVRMNDVDCLAEALYFEARGTGEQGLRAVGEVIVNRANDPRFPDTICGVVDQRYNGSCQFSYRCDGKPEEFTNPIAYANAQSVAHQLLSNRGEDITNGALFFHASSMAPGWFGTLTRHGQFGGNIFYS